MTDIVIEDFYKKAKYLTTQQIDNQNCLLRSMKYVFEFLSPYKLNYSLLFLAIGGNNYIFEPKENYVGIDIEDTNNYRLAPFNIEILNKKNRTKSEIIKKIKEKLNKKIPVIASVMNSELKHNDIHYSYHAITIYGIKDNETLLFLDPTVRSVDSINSYIGEIKIDKFLDSHLIIFLFSDIENLYEISQEYICNGDYYKKLFKNIEGNKDFFNFRNISSVFKKFLNKKIEDMILEESIYSSCLEIYYKSKISGPIFYINLFKDLNINCKEFDEIIEKWEVILNRLLYLGQKNDVDSAKKYLENLINSFENDFLGLYGLISKALEDKNKGGILWE